MHQLLPAWIQGRIKVGATDAAALGPFLKWARVRTDKNFLEA